MEIYACVVAEVWLYLWWPVCSSSYFCDTLLVSSCGSLFVVWSPRLAMVSLQTSVHTASCSLVHVWEMWLIHQFDCKQFCPHGWLWQFSLIVALSSFSSSGIWHCYWEYSTLSKKPDANVIITDIGFHTDLSIYLQHSQTWLIFSMLSSTTQSLHTNLSLTFHDNLDLMFVL